MSYGNRRQSTPTSSSSKILKIHKFHILHLIRGYQMSYGQWLLKCYITLSQLENCSLISWFFQTQMRCCTSQHSAFLVPEPKGQKRQKNRWYGGLKLKGRRYGDIEHRQLPSIPLLGTSLWNTDLLQCAVLLQIAGGLYYTLFESSALLCIALYRITLHCIALHCIALYCIALHCIEVH